MLRARHSGAASAGHILGRPPAAQARSRAALRVHCSSSSSSSSSSQPLSQPSLPGLALPLVGQAQPPSSSAGESDERALRMRPPHTHTVPPLGLAVTPQRSVIWWMLLPTRRAKQEAPPSRRLPPTPPPPACVRTTCPGPSAAAAVLGPGDRPWTKYHAALQRTLSKRRLLQRGQSVLVAVSGGQVRPQVSGREGGREAGWGGGVSGRGEGRGGAVRGHKRWLLNPAHSMPRHSS